MPSPLKLYKNWNRSTHSLFKYDQERKISTNAIFHPYGPSSKWGVFSHEGKPELEEVMTHLIKIYSLSYKHINAIKEVEHKILSNWMNQLIKPAKSKARTIRHIYKVICISKNRSGYPIKNLLNSFPATTSTLPTNSMAGLSELELFS